MEQDRLKVTSMISLFVSRMRCIRLPSPLGRDAQLYSLAVLGTVVILATVRIHIVRRTYRRRRLIPYSYSIYCTIYIHYTVTLL